jgi:hypothetical protein
MGDWGLRADSAMLVSSSAGAAADDPSPGPSRDEDASGGVRPFEVWKLTRLGCRVRVQASEFRVQTIGLRGFVPRVLGSGVRSFGFRDYG